MTSSSSPPKKRRNKRRNTETRKLSDSTLKNRPAVLVEGDGIDWKRYLLKDFYPSIRTKAIICSEAFKILEKLFTESLRSFLTQPRNTEVMLQLQQMVLEEAHSFAYPENDNWWYLHLTFGIFASALFRLREIDVSAISSNGKAKRDADVAAASKLFGFVLQDVLDVLEEETDSVIVGNQDIQKSIEFVRNKENLDQVIEEFAYLARLRASRNRGSHPFGSTIPEEEKRAALDFYQCTLTEDYASKFRNVGYIGLLALNRQTQSIDDTIRKATEKMQALYNLL